MVRIKGRLTAEVGELLFKAMDAANSVLYAKVNRPTSDSVESNVSAEIPPAADERVNIAQRRADALGLILESALTNGLDKGTRGDRYQVVVHVDQAVLEDPTKPGQSEIEDGPALSAETSRRLAFVQQAMVEATGQCEVF